MIRSSGRVALLLLLIGGSAQAQAPSDSVAAWTAALQTGSLQERVDAGGRLARLEPATLPAAAQNALVAELVRLNTALFAGTPIEGVESLGGETFAEYYLDLAMAVARIDSDAARRALVLSVGTGRGIQRRVAQQGDPVIPVLAQMIARDYESGPALETMALAWFWSDSTGAPLSGGSRSTISRALTSAGANASYSVRRGAATSFALAGDPAFLPVAQALAAQADAAGEGFVSGAVRRTAVPRLTAAAAALSTASLLERVSRAASAVCADATDGRRRGLCESTMNDLGAAAGHVAGGRTLPASEVLRAAAGRLDAVRADGVLTDGEYALIAGGIAMIRARL